MGYTRKNGKKPTAARINQLNDFSAFADIKQEPDIKEEPQPVCMLEEFPALLNDHESGPTFVGLNQIDNASNPHDANAIEEPMDNYHADNLSECDAPNQQNNRNENAAVNANNSSRPNTRRKILKQLKCDRCEYTTKYKTQLQTHSIYNHKQKQFKKFLVLCRSELRHD